MTDHARILAIAARSGGAVAETVLDGATIEETAQGFIANKLRETGERGSEHAALMVESLVTEPWQYPPPSNREDDPCPDGECTHVYDEWPANSVTRRDREIDQCPDCGWTELEKDDRP